MSGAREGRRPEARIALYCAVMAAGFAVILAIMFARGQWVADAEGTPILADFVPFYLAGREALRGHAGAVYDTASFSRLQIALAPAGHGWFPWAYPPTVFLMLAPLSLAPYALAFIGFETVTLTLFALAARAIVRRPAAAALVFASPLSLFNFFIGQDAFLTGSLLAAALLWLERQPVLAGIALGLLTYKPQFGLLFPVVLGVTGQWRAVGAAIVTAAILAAGATAAFGTAVWESFLGAMTVHGRSTFSAGDVAWDKIQTVYGVIRGAGGGERLAWACHVAVALAVTFVVCRFWRRPAPYALKAAMLAAGAMIVTPYELTYDLAAIAVPLAFLARDRMARGPVAGELAGAGAVVAGVFLISPATPVLGSLPLGPVLLLGLAWSTLRRRDAAAVAA